jgi:hypothetical protein
MLKCAKVDPDEEDSYDGLGTDYVNIWKNRYVAFIERHNLKAQLIREDEAGIR